MNAIKPRSNYHPASRLLAGVLAGSIAMGPAASATAGYEIASPTEAFSFPDTAGSDAGRGSGGAEQKGTGSREAPVGNDGAFGHSLEIRVPPGRLGFAPRLTIGYSSARAKRAGNAGAGWNLSVPTIERDTTAGFPQLWSLQQDPSLPGAGPLVYDDQSFLAPAGQIVPTNLPAGGSGGPSTATGTLYVPLLEQSPVRYEFRTATDQWIEHDPSGVKRYQGHSRVA